VCYKDFATSRIVSREHWVINNRDYSRRARNYCTMQRIRPVRSCSTSRSVFTSSYCIHLSFYCFNFKQCANNYKYTI